MRNIVAIIQARTCSKRLPDKVLLGLEGRTVLEHIIERVKDSRLVNDVVVATTIRREDLKIARLCSKKGIRIYCGSEEDVLDRYYQAARILGADHVVRITADCPLVDPRVIDKVVHLHMSRKADYTSNVIRESFPDGEDCEVFKFEVLKNAWQNAKLSSEREHVTPYIIKHPEIFKLENLDCKINLSQKRWTLDEIEDYKFIKLIYKRLYKKNRIFGMDKILDLVKRYPEYEKINNKIPRNEGYSKSLAKDKLLTLDLG